MKRFYASVLFVIWHVWANNGILAVAVKLDPCQRQQFVSTCTNPDGTMTRSQFVLRYYKRDYECVSYPYGHCRKNPEAPELFKYKDECEKTCLGVPSSVNAGPLIADSNSSASAEATEIVPSRSLAPVWQRPSVTQSTSTVIDFSTTTAPILAPIDQRGQQPVLTQSTSTNSSTSSTILAVTSSSAAAIQQTIAPATAPVQQSVTVPPVQTTIPTLAQPITVPPATPAASIITTTTTPDIFDVTVQNETDRFVQPTPSIVIVDEETTQNPVPQSTLPPVSPANSATSAPIGQSDVQTSGSTANIPVTIPVAEPAQAENEEAGSSFLDLLSPSGSKCLQQRQAALARQHAENSTESASQSVSISGGFVPKCTSSGSFEQVQCDSKSAICWCVDVDEGIELPGTRTPTTRGQPDCLTGLMLHGSSILENVHGRDTGTKPGTCPAPRIGELGVCIRECRKDIDCPGHGKCCYNGCGRLCLFPHDVTNIQSGTDNTSGPNPTTKPIQICDGSAEPGPCTQQTLVRWYYDATKRSCETFNYGGCGGNGNNYETKNECETRCAPQESPLCGPSAEPLEDKQGKLFDCLNQTCPPNWKCSYTTSKAVCCPDDGSNKAAASLVNDICRLPKDRGTCDKYELRFYYNAEVGECKYFFFGGCGGNENNFKELAECQRVCGKQSPSQDSQPPIIGPINSTSESTAADSQFPDFGLIPTTQRIAQSTISVIPTTPSQPSTKIQSSSEIQTPASRAMTNSALPTSAQSISTTTASSEEEEEEIESSSIGQSINTPLPAAPPAVRPQIEPLFPSPPAIRPPGEPRPQLLPPEEPQSSSLLAPGDRCSHPKDSGPCSGRFVRWFWDPAKKTCEVFTYSGCQGNGNNFGNREECLNACRELPADPCQHPRDKGECPATFHRFFYDPTDDMCKEFVYGGCGGNGNNFGSAIDCEIKCKKNRASITLHEQIFCPRLECGPECVMITRNSGCQECACPDYNDDDIVSSNVSTFSILSTPETEVDLDEDYTDPTTNHSSAFGISTIVLTANTVHLDVVTTTTTTKPSTSTLRSESTTRFHSTAFPPEALKEPCPPVLCPLNCHFVPDMVTRCLMCNCSIGLKMPDSESRTIISHFTKSHSGRSDTPSSVTLINDSKCPHLQNSCPPTCLVPSGPRGCRICVCPASTTSPRRNGIGEVIGRVTGRNFSTTTPPGSTHATLPTSTNARIDLFSLPSAFCGPLSECEVGCTLALDLNGCINCRCANDSESVDSIETDSFTEGITVDNEEDYGLNSSALGFASPPSPIGAPSLRPNVNGFELRAPPTVAAIDQQPINSAIFPSSSNSILPSATLVPIVLPGEGDSSVTDPGIPAQPVFNLPAAAPASGLLQIPLLESSLNDAGYENGGGNAPASKPLPPSSDEKYTPAPQQRGSPPSATPPYASPPSVAIPATALPIGNEYGAPVGGPPSATPNPPAVPTQASASKAPASEPQPPSITPPSPVTTVVAPQYTTPPVGNKPAIAPAPPSIQPPSGSPASVVPNPPAPIPASVPNPAPAIAPLPPSIQPPASISPTAAVPQPPASRGPPSATPQAPAAIATQPAPVPQSPATGGPPAATLQSPGLPPVATPASSEYSPPVGTPHIPQPPSASPPYLAQPTPASAIAGSPPSSKPLPPAAVPPPPVSQGPASASVPAASTGSPPAVKPLPPALPPPAPPGAIPQAPAIAAATPASIGQYSSQGPAAGPATTCPEIGTCAVGCHLTDNDIGCPVCECPPLPLNVCLHPKDPGNCKGAFGRAWYDISDNTCKQFSYTGCRGNGNNFATVAECEEMCIGKSPQAQSAATPASAGSPPAALPQPPAFTAPQSPGGAPSGAPQPPASQPNGNAPHSPAGAPSGAPQPPGSSPPADTVENEESEPESDEESSIVCPSVKCGSDCFPITNQRGCLECLCPGNGKRPSGNRLHSSSTISSKTVSPFIPVSGFKAVFRQLQGYTSSVANNKTTPTTKLPTTTRATPASAAVGQSPPSSGNEEDKCSQPMDPGPCEGPMDKRWWFNAESGQCESFMYGGCAGNRNHFYSLKECEIHCARFAKGKGTGAGQPIPASSGGQSSPAPSTGNAPAGSDKMPHPPSATPPIPQPPGGPIPPGIPTPPHAPGASSPGEAGALPSAVPNAPAIPPLAHPPPALPAAIPQPPAVVPQPPAEPRPPAGPQAPAEPRPPAEPAQLAPQGPPQPPSEPYPPSGSGQAASNGQGAPPAVIPQAPAAPEIPQAPSGPPEPPSGSAPSPPSPAQPQAPPISDSGASNAGQPPQPPSGAIAPQPQSQGAPSHGQQPDSGPPPGPPGSSPPGSPSAPSPAASGSGDQSSGSNQQSGSGHNGQSGRPSGNGGEYSKESNSEGYSGQSSDGQGSYGSDSSGGYGSNGGDSGGYGGDQSEGGYGDSGQSGGYGGQSQGSDSGQSGYGDQGGGSYGGDSGGGYDSGGDQGGYGGGSSDQSDGYGQGQGGTPACPNGQAAASYSNGGPVQCLPGSPDEGSTGYGDGGQSNGGGGYGSSDSGYSDESTQGGGYKIRRQANPRFARASGILPYLGNIAQNGANEAFVASADSEETPQPKAYCNRPKDVGPCKGAHLRWYYDSDSGTCNLFYYGGCKGNKNNFATEEHCQIECLAKSRAPLFCPGHIPPLGGENPILCSPLVACPEGYACYGSICCLQPAENNSTSISGAPGILPQAPGIQPSPPGTRLAAFNIANGNNLIGQFSPPSVYSPVIRKRRGNFSPTNPRANELRQLENGDQIFGPPTIPNANPAVPLPPEWEEPNSYNDEKILHPVHPPTVRTIQNTYNRGPVDAFRPQIGGENGPNNRVFGHPTLPGDKTTLDLFACPDGTDPLRGSSGQIQTCGAGFDGVPLCPRGYYCRIDLEQSIRMCCGLGASVDKQQNSENENGKGYPIRTKRDNSALSKLLLRQKRGGNRGQQGNKQCSGGGCQLQGGPQAGFGSAGIGGPPGFLPPGVAGGGVFGQPSLPGGFQPPAVGGGCGSSGCGGQSGAGQSYGGGKSRDLCNGGGCQLQGGPQGGLGAGGVGGPPGFFPPGVGGAGAVFGPPSVGGSGSGCGSQGCGQSSSSGGYGGQSKGKDLCNGGGCQLLGGPQSGVGGPPGFFPPGIQGGIGPGGGSLSGTGAVFGPPSVGGGGSGCGNSGCSGNTGGGGYGSSGSGGSYGGNAKGKGDLCNGGGCQLLGGPQGGGLGGLGGPPGFFPPGAQGAGGGIFGQPSLPNGFQPPSVGGACGSGGCGSNSASSGSYGSGNKGSDLCNGGGCQLQGGPQAALGAGGLPPSIGGSGVFGQPSLPSSGSGCGNAGCGNSGSNSGSYGGGKKSSKDLCNGGGCQLLGGPNAAAGLGGIGGPPGFSPPGLSSSGGGVFGVPSLPNGFQPPSVGGSGCNGGGCGGSSNTGSYGGGNSKKKDLCNGGGCQLLGGPQAGLGAGGIGGPPGFFPPGAASGQGVFGPPSVGQQGGCGSGNCGNQGGSAGGHGGKGKDLCGGGGCQLQGGPQSGFGAAGIGGPPGLLPQGVGLGAALRAQAVQKSSGEILQTGPVQKLTNDTVSIESICTQPSASGRDCGAEEKQPRTNLYYFYSTEDKRCKLFFYKGCGGNENRFSSRRECVKMCEGEEFPSTSASPLLRRRRS